MFDSTVINLLLQIPLAGVIVYVVYLFLQYIKSLFEKMIGFMKEEAENNREFLKTQREQNNAALARLAEEQKLMREQQAKMTQVLETMMKYSAPVNKKNRNV